MSREEFLLNVLNVLTPVVNGPNEGNARHAAENLYVDTLAALEDEIYPKEEDADIGEPGDEWEHTLRKSITLLENKLVEYLNNK